MDCQEITQRVKDGIPAWTRDAKNHLESLMWLREPFFCNLIEGCSMMQLCLKQSCVHFLEYARRACVKRSCEIWMKSSEKSQATISDGIQRKCRQCLPTGWLQATVPPSIEPLASESERSTQPYDYRTSIYIYVSVLSWPALVKANREDELVKATGTWHQFPGPQEIGRNIPGSSSQLHVVHLPGEEMGPTLRIKRCINLYHEDRKNNAW